MYSMYQLLYGMLYIFCQLQCPERQQTPKTKKKKGRSFPLIPRESGDDFSELMYTGGVA
jgi:hypothetical protein